MTIKDVMSELGLSRDSVYRRIRDKQLEPLPKLNPNRRIEPLRFRPEDVERLKENPPRVEAS